MWKDIQEIYVSPLDSPWYFPADIFLRLYAAPASASPSLVQPNSSYLQICMTPLHPFSHGSIHIQSGDPFQQPAIDLNAWGLDIGMSRYRG